MLLRESGEGLYSNYNTPSVPQNFGKLSFEARNKGSANRMTTFDSSLESPDQDDFIDNKFIKINIFNQCQIWETLLKMARR